MPPPIPEHVKRFTANPTRPARYRPGKAIQQEDSSEEDEEEEEQVQPQRPQPKRPSRAQTRPQLSAQIDQDGADEDEAGFVTEEEEEEEEEDDDTDNGFISTRTTTKAAPDLSTTPIPGRAQLPRRDQSDEDEDVDESEENESSEAESSSEEEVPQRKFQRPKFIKKSERETNTPVGEHTAEDANQEHKSRSSLVPEVLSSTHTQSTAARRLAEAELQIKSTIERETAARLAGRRNWDDDDDLPAEALVDDTDGLDPEAEHSAWRLRELRRLKRDREALVAREKELEEIDRRRNLTKEEREAEDREFIAKQKQEKEDGRGQVGYMARYHHKGAFFLDDETSQRMRERNLVGAKFQDEVTDKSTLPEYMRVRDMTKLGKKGRTRYTDLKGQDTGRFGESVKRWKGSGYENQNRQGDQGDTRGVDERFLPDNDDRRRGGGGPDVSGANASELGRKRERRASRSRSSHDEDDRRDSYRPRSRSRSRSGERDRRRRRRSYSRSPSRSRSRSRSRSPPYKSRRRRSPSPYEDVDRDRRRRIAT